MPARRLVGLVAACVLLVPASALAANGQGGGSDYKVTGGGQVIAEASAQGPGDTIAFTAQRTEENPDGADPARGQLQVVHRGEDGTERGRDQVIFHGRVSCIVPESSSTARFGGEGRDPRTGATSDFVVDVVDAEERGEDWIAFRWLDEDTEGDRETPCDDDDDSVTSLRDTRLARGNLTVHDRRAE